MLVKPPEFFCALEALVAPSHAFLRSQSAYAFTVLNWGRYIFDPTSKNPVRESWSEQDVNLRVITNQQTLEDIILGNFDPAAPEEEHLFLWSGEKTALTELHRALNGVSRGVLNFRLNQEGA